MFVLLRLLSTIGPPTYSLNEQSSSHSTLWQELLGSIFSPWLWALDAICIKSYRDVTLLKLSVTVNLQCQTYTSGRNYVVCTLAFIYCWFPCHFFITHVHSGKTGNSELVVGFLLITPDHDRLIASVVFYATWTMETTARQFGVGLPK